MLAATELLVTQSPFLTVERRGTLLQTPADQSCTNIEHKADVCPSHCRPSLLSWLAQLLVRVRLNLSTRPSVCGWYTVVFTFLIPMRSYTSCSNFDRRHLNFLIPQLLLSSPPLHQPLSFRSLSWAVGLILGCEDFVIGIPNKLPNVAPARDTLQLIRNNVSTQHTVKTENQKMRRKSCAAVTHTPVQSTIR